MAFKTSLGKRCPITTFENLSVINYPTEAGSKATLLGIVTSFSPMTTLSKHKCFEGQIADNERSLRFVGFTPEQVLYRQYNKLMVNMFNIPNFTQKSSYNNCILTFIFFILYRNKSPSKLPLILSLAECSISKSKMGDCQEVALHNNTVMEGTNT